MYDPNIMFTVGCIHSIIQLQTHAIFKYEAEHYVANNNININGCDVGYYRLLDMGRKTHLSLNISMKIIISCSMSSIFEQIWHVIPSPTPYIHIIWLQRTSSDFKNAPQYEDLQYIIAKVAVLMTYTKW